MSSALAGDTETQERAALYAAMAAAADAMLHATDDASLCQRVCDAVVRHGQFLCVSVFLRDPDTDAVQLAAFSIAPGIGLDNANQAALAELACCGQGLAAAALETKRPCRSEDLRHDKSTLTWRTLADRAGVASGLAVPLVSEAKRVRGVVLAYSAGRWSTGNEVMAQFGAMVANLGSVLDRFAREQQRLQAERALQASEEKYRNIFETIEDAYYEVDLRGDLVLVNPAFCRMLGYSLNELIGLNNRELQTSEAATNVYHIFNEVYRTGVPIKSFDWDMVRKDGSTGMGEGSVQLVRDAAGNPRGFCGILRDVTVRREMERALRESEARFRALTNLSSDWYWELDAEFRYTRIESRSLGAGAAGDALLGSLVWETGMEIHAPGGVKAHRATLLAHKPFRDVVMYRRLADGSPYYIGVSGEPLFDSAGNFAGYRGVSREITGQKIAEERIQYLATHDTLTGLPNRFMFSELLNNAIAASARNGTSFAVLFIDLDRFKYVNDTLGHDNGDRLLREIATRFRQSLRAADVLARLGGDEFVILAQSPSDAAQAARIANKILAAAVRPIVLKGQECRVTASMGIAMYPMNGEDEQALMKNADIAMYYAKEEGKNNFQFYSRELTARSQEKLRVEARLRKAQESKGLSLRYQPKIDLRTGAITGAEALLRWHDAELGTVPPSRFIPVAEETGMIVPIGRWVLKTACAQNMAWQRRGLRPIRIAVNLSVRQFADERLLEDLSAVLHDTGMPPDLLEIEITEGMVIHHPERAVEVLKAIKSMGVRLAIDDFGTGYSSLGQLKTYPIDTLKIDRSFVHDIVANSEDKAITKAIIAMGKSLGLTVVAEGVETPEQQRFLHEHGCDEMQGYVFSKAVAADEFAALLGAHSAGG